MRCVVGKPTHTLLNNLTSDWFWTLYIETNTFKEAHRNLNPNTHKHKNSRYFIIIQYNSNWHCSQIAILIQSTYSLCQNARACQASFVLEDSVIMMIKYSCKQKSSFFLIFAGISIDSSTNLSPLPKIASAHSGIALHSFIYFHRNAFWENCFIVYCV